MHRNTSKIHCVLPYLILVVLRVTPRVGLRSRVPCRYASHDRHSPSACAVGFRPYLLHIIKGSLDLMAHLEAQLSNSAFLCLRWTLYIPILMSFNKKRPAASQPNVRNACEECHERKIRCQISPEGGCCQACESSGRQCFFLPRYKSGRPRRDNTSNPKNNVPATNPSYQTLNLGIHSPLPSDKQATDMQMEMGSFDWQAATAHLPMPQTPDLDRDYFDTFGDDNSFINSALDLGSGLPSSPSPSDTDSKSDRPREERFASLLSQCVKLQQHSESMRDVASSLGSESSASNVTLQFILRDIDSSCAAVLQIFEDPLVNSASKPSDSALLALTIAIISQVFDLCDVLVHSMMPNVQSLNTMFLLKRLECNMMQARMAMSQINRMEQSLSSLNQNAVNKAWMIDQRLKLITDKNQPLWS